MTDEHLENAVELAKVAAPTRRAKPIRGFGAPPSDPVVASKPKPKPKPKSKAKGRRRPAKASKHAASKAPAAPPPLPKRIAPVLKEPKPVEVQADPVALPELVKPEKPVWVAKYRVCASKEKCAINGVVFSAKKGQILSLSTYGRHGLQTLLNQGLKLEAVE